MLAVHLGQPREYFGDKVNEGNSILRVIHYPPLARDGEDGAAALANAVAPRGGARGHQPDHAAAGRGRGGLQILRRDGTWLDVNPPPGCVTCNIGDMLQRLSNRRLPSRRTGW